MKQLLAMMFLTVMPMALPAQGGAKPNNTQGQATIDAQIKTLKDSLKLYKDDIEFKKGALKAHRVQFDVRDYGHTPEQKGASKSLQLKWLQQELAAEKKEFLYLAPFFDKLFTDHKCDENCSTDYIIFEENGSRYIRTLIKSSVTFTAPEIKRDGEEDEQVVEKITLKWNDEDVSDSDVEDEEDKEDGPKTIAPAHMGPVKTFNTSTRFSKDGQSTYFTTKMAYTQPARDLEQFASRYFWRDSTSASLKEAAGRYSLTLGNIEDDNMRPAGGAQIFSIIPLLHYDNYLYNYALSYEKIANNRKRTSRRNVIYDATEGRILQLEDVASPSVVDSIRQDAGKAFINMTAVKSVVIITYKKEKKRKVVRLSFKDANMFAPRFNELIAAIQRYEVTDEQAQGYKEMKSTYQGETICKKSIYFTLGDIVISNFAEKALSDFADYANKYLDCQIILEGYHSHCHTKDDGKNCDKRRVDNVMKMLVEKYGIVPTRIKKEAYGCPSEEQLNGAQDFTARRVIMLLIP